MQGVPRKNVQGSAGASGSRAERSLASQVITDMKISLIFLAASTLAAQTHDDLVKADPNNWLHYSGSYDSQRHSPLKQIDTANVRNLAPKWMFHVAGSVKLEAVPLVVNGVMFVAQLNHVDALDARSGRLIWQYQRGAATRGAHRGIAVSDNKIYVGPADHAVRARDD